MNEGNVLFNDAQNTFYLWLYGIRHMVKDHSDSGWKEGNVLFNDAMNTFYLWLYGITHKVKDHLDSERGNLLQTPGLIFLISFRNYFICAPFHKQDSTYHGLCYTSRGKLSGTRNSSMGPP